MKAINILIGSTVLLSLSGCSVSPVHGAFNFSKWDGSISNPSVSSVKSGESCARSVLGLIAFGNASIEAAKKAADISKVATVDHKTTNILYFYGEYCTIVYGE
ncbi:TRL-like family protein [Oceanobacter sp. 5_MG-2023]|uniref:TRL-like family protein n=1 Tax=Oceanobacter sp. 5_MG-2023 TaxID=3062645 RepID=UPI0026E436EC|nr:TRL-like family protein [Oceanobacter sp. 5_MG-2023]MDO6681575.1 TRL-like family protein [Oceanobacter sp. 5_MG-2023]